MLNKRYSPRNGVIVMLVIFCVLFAVLSCRPREKRTDKYSFYESVMDTSKPPAWGDDRDIYVFCDEATWKDLSAFLKSSLEREMFVVVNEKYFTLIKSDLKDIDRLSRYKNLLFLGDLKSQAAVSEHIRESMDERMLERTENSGGEIFAARNRWVKDQLIVYLVGSNLENLVKLTVLQSNRLFSLFLDRLGERLAYQAYRTKIIPEEFFEPFPFTIKIPENYRLFHDDKKNRFLSFMFRMRSETRESPDKYVSVYYEDMEADGLNLDWIIEKRRKLAYKYYDKDEFDPKLVRSERLEFGKYQAWRLMGPWRNMKHDIGGGFQTFAFYDAELKKAFLIDNVVYFPAGDKLPVLLELQKISATFEAKTPSFLRHEGLSLLKAHPRPDRGQESMLFSF